MAYPFWSEWSLVLIVMLGMFLKGFILGWLFFRVQLRRRWQEFETFYYHEHIYPLMKTARARAQVQAQLLHDFRTWLINGKR